MFRVIYATCLRVPRWPPGAGALAFPALVPGPAVPSAERQGRSRCPLALALLQAGPLKACPALPVPSEHSLAVEAETAEPVCQLLNVGVVPVEPPPGRLTWKQLTPLCGHWDRSGARTTGVK